MKLTVGEREIDTDEIDFGLILRHPMNTVQYTGRDTIEIHFQDIMDGDEAFQKSFQVLEQTRDYVKELFELDVYKITWVSVCYVIVELSLTPRVFFSVARLKEMPHFEINVYGKALNIKRFYRGNKKDGKEIFLTQLDPAPDIPEELWTQELPLAVNDAVSKLSSLALDEAIDQSLNKDWEVVRVSDKVDLVTCEKEQDTK